MLRESCGLGMQKRCDLTTEQQKVGEQGTEDWRSTGDGGNKTQRYTAEQYDPNLELRTRQVRSAGTAIRTHSVIPDIYKDQKRLHVL